MRQTPATSINTGDDIVSYPIREAFRRLSIGTTTGHSLVKNGELRTYRIGARRYVTKQALQDLISKRLAESLNESAASRAAKVQRAIHGRTRSRDRT
jgi:hypothetical protein